MEHGVREIKEKGLLPVFLDEGDGLVCVKACQFYRIGGPLNHVTIPQEGDAALVLEVDDLDVIKIVEDSKVMIETLLSRQERFMESKVPLPDTGSGVSVRLEEFGEGNFVWMNTGGGISAVDPCGVADATRITACQESGPGGTADRGGRIIVGESDAFRREGVNARSSHLSCAIAAEIVIALIVDENEDHVGLVFSQSGLNKPRKT
jgi:hypothetical protein